MKPNTLNWKHYQRSKYGNRKASYNGVVYHSQLEAEYAQDLDLRVKAKDIKSWERQVKLSLDVNGVHICNYFIDFLIHHNDGSREYVEAKGFPTDLWRLKWKLTQALWDEICPDAKLTLVKG